MKAQSNNQILENAVRNWRHIAPLVVMPKNNKELELLINRLDKLLDIVGENENHPVMSLVNIMGDNISKYENRIYKNKMGTGISALKFLMEEQALTQQDLPEIGSQGVVSEILSGKRQLNIRQIKLLAERFSVEPETFIEGD